MKIYVVFEDVDEAYEYSFEKLFISVHLKKEDAEAKVAELKRDHNHIYFEEMLVN